MRNILLPKTQRLAGGNLELKLDQIVTGNHLGYRMLDLNTRIDLDKIIVLVGI